MKEYKVQENYRKLSELLVAQMSRYSILLFFAVGILNLILSFLGFFQVNRIYLIITYFICMCIFFIPAFITEILVKEAKKLPNHLSVILPLTAGFLFTASTDNESMILAIPLLILTLYNDKKYLKIATVSTIISSFFSYTARYYIESLSGYISMSYEKYILTLFVPCLCILCIISFICSTISSRFFELIKQILQNTMQLEEKQDDLDNLVDNSSMLISAQTITLDNSILSGIVYIIKNLLHTEEHVPYVVGIIEDNSWKIISEGGKYSYAEKGDHIHIGFLRKTYSFFYKQSKDESALFMRDIESFAFPFYENNKLVGFAVFSMKLPEELLSSIVTAYALISKAISNMILNKKVFSTQEELVFNLAEVCEAKSEQTGQHVKRIAKYMEIFGDALGLDPLEKKVVSIASMLHDVGKLTIPIEILDKPGKLTDEEYEIIKSHTKIGYEMLKNCSGVIMQYASKMALEHHERWDGRGYNKITGEDIDYYSRYVAVADVFDALASKRSYKKAWSVEEVRDEIVRCSGTQFCPDAVDKFVENFDRFVEVRNSMPDVD